MPADLAQLFDQYYASLVRMLYRRVGDRDRAEDLAQETFARAVAAPPNNPRPWLFAVAPVAAPAAFAGSTPAQAAPTGKDFPVAALCGTAPKGYATCFALRRTDVSSGKGLQPNVDVAGYGPADLAAADRAEVEAAALEPGDGLDRGPARLDVAQHLPGRPEQGLARRGQDDGPAGPVEQRGTELGLELAHRLRDRRLRHVLGLGGTGHAALVDDGEEQPETAEIHWQ